MKKLITQKLYKMLVVDLRDFGGGKIFNDQFNQVLPKLMCEGEKEMEIKYRGHTLGVVEIVASFSCTSFYNNQDLAYKLSNQKMKEPGNDVLLVVKYKQRDMGIHSMLMLEWWDDLKLSQQTEQP